MGYETRVNEDSLSVTTDILFCDALEHVEQVTVNIRCSVEDATWPSADVCHLDKCHS